MKSYEIGSFLKKIFDRNQISVIRKEDQFFALTLQGYQRSFFTCEER